MNIWVIGPGPTLLKHKELIRELKDRNTFTFQNVFPNIIDYFGIEPTYWTWHDPQASKRGFDFLNKNKNTKTKILSPHPVCCEFVNTNKIADFEKYFSGGLPYPNNGRCTEAADNHKQWSSLISNYKNLKNYGLITEIPTTSLSYLLRTNPLHDVVKLMNPINRFNYDKVIFGSSLYQNNWYMRENKLTILQYLGFKKVFIMGFDGLWGRFYDKDWKTKGFVGEYKFLDKWVEWQSITDMELFSVTECAINKYVKYIPFRNALKIDDEERN